MLTEWRAYGFDMFHDGYNLNSATEIPRFFFKEAYIYENLVTMLPSVKFVFTDAAGAFFDKRREGQLVLFTGIDNYRWFDFAVLGYDAKDSYDVKRSATLDRIYYGLDIMSLWMLQTQSRSFGNKMVRDVVTDVWSDVVNDYSKYTKINMSYDIQGATGQGSFIQTNNSIKFLQYLKSVAGGFDKTGYLSWLERTDTGATLHFRNIDSLKNQQVSMYMEVQYDPRTLSDAFLGKNDGLIAANTLPVLYSHVDKGNGGIFTSDPVWNVYNFDLENNVITNEVHNLYSNVSDTGKDIGYSFANNAYKSTYGKRIGVKTGYDSLIRMFAMFQEARLKRRIWIWTTGSSQLRVGQKVRMIVPSGYSSDMFESISGDWIVGSIIHCISAPDFRYFMKVGLVAEEFYSQPEN